MHGKLLIILFLITSLSLSAERTYLQIEVESEPWDDFKLTLSPEWRTDPDNDWEQYHTDISLEYAIANSWDVGIGYRYGKSKEEDDPEVDIERFSANSSYTFKWLDFRIQARIRYLLDQEDQEEDLESFRYRMKLSYDWNQVNLRPYVYYERREMINTVEDKDRNVYGTGLTWKINKSHSLTAEYQWIDKVYSTKDYEVFKFSYGFEF